MFDNYANNQATRPPPPPPPARIVRFDRRYVETAPGILKIIQIIANLAGFICIKVTNVWVSSIFFNILYWLGNIVSLVLFLVYLFHIVEKFSQWPWQKFEFAFNGLMSLMYIGCSIFAATLGESVGYAVGFFGLCAIIAYGVDGFLKYKSWKKGLPPQ